MRDLFLHFSAFHWAVLFRATLTWRAGINFKFWPDRTFRIKSFPGHFTAAVATAMKWRPTTESHRSTPKEK